MLFPFYLVDAENILLWHVSLQHFFAAFQYIYICGWCRAGGDSTEEVLFVSAAGLVSRNLVSTITVQSRTAKGIAVLNLQARWFRIHGCLMGTSSKHMAFL